MNDTKKIDRPWWYTGKVEQLVSKDLGRPVPFDTLHKLSDKELFVLEVHLDAEKDDIGTGDPTELPLSSLDNFKPKGLDTEWTGVPWDDEFREGHDPRDADNFTNFVSRKDARMFLKHGIMPLFHYTKGFYDRDVIYDPPYHVVHDIKVKLKGTTSDGKIYEGLCLDKDKDGLSNGGPLRYVRFWGNGQTSKQFERIVNKGDSLSCIIF